MRTCDWIIFSLSVSYLGNKTAQSRSALTPRENVKGRKEEGIPGEGRCAFHSELQCPSVLLSSTGLLVASPWRLVLIQCVCVRVRVRLMYISSKWIVPAFRCVCASVVWQGIVIATCHLFSVRTDCHNQSQSEAPRNNSRIQSLRCCFI